MLRTFRNAELWIVGEKGESTDQIKFFGMRQSSEIPDILAETDIFVYTPHPQKGAMDNCVLEAMAMGKPSVLSDVECVRDAVTHLKDGFLVPYGDEDRLEEAVGSLIKDKSLRQELGRKALRTAQEKFDVAERSQAIRGILLFLFSELQSGRRCLLTRMHRLRFVLFIINFVSFSLAVPLNAHEDGLGNYTVRAYRLEGGSPPEIDGILNDEAWEKAYPISGFVWKDFPGKPASEKTVAYVVYDQYHLYVGFRCYDSESENIVNRISRRGNAFDSDVISFFIDPYHDHRTGYKFVCTPGGVKDDNYRYDDSKVDSSWEGVWWAEGNIDDLGWTAEFQNSVQQFSLY